MKAKNHKLITKRIVWEAGANATLYLVVSQPLGFGLNSEGYLNNCRIYILAATSLMILHFIRVFCGGLKLNIVE